MYKIKVFGTETMETEVILDEELYPYAHAFSIMSELEHDMFWLTLPKDHLTDLKSKPPMAKTLIYLLYYDGQAISLFLNSNDVNFSIIEHLDTIQSDKVECLEVETIPSPFLYFNVECCVTKFNKLENLPIKVDRNKQTITEIYKISLIKKNDMEDYFFYELEQAIIGTGSKGIILDNITSLHSKDLTVREYMRLYSRLNNLELKYGLSIIN